MKRIIGKVKRRIKEVLSPSKTIDFNQVNLLAKSVHCDLQYAMDIDPASPWFSADLVKNFGGFHPPGETRALNRINDGDRVRSDTLTLLLREIVVRKVPGAMAELGVYRGASARLLHHYSPERKLYLFDTFAGFSQKDFEKESIKVGFNQQQQFTDTSVAAVTKTIAAKNDNVIFFAGWFPDTVTPAVAAETFAFVHLDADLEAPIAAALEFFWPRLSPGGFIVVHDYNAWPGPRLAVDRFRMHERVSIVPIADKSGSVVICKPE